MAKEENCVPYREKWWSEIDSDEKIERMRKEVKRIDRAISRMRAQIYRLNHHLHGEQGELLQKLLTTQEEGIVPFDKDGDDVYF